MDEQLDVMLDVIDRLDALGIRYMLSGSVAMDFYAQPRMTRDIDLVVELGPEDAERVVAAFDDDYYVDESAVRDAVARRGMFNAIHVGGAVKVDLIVRRESEYRRTEFERRRSIDYEGRGLWVVTPEDLLLSKLDWARDTRSEIQLSDARNLVTSATDMDWDYLTSWAARLGLGSLLDEVRS